MNHFWLDASAMAFLVLISSDLRLTRAAKAEGLITFNPETDDQQTLDSLIN
ncbi:MAG: hypothetical protein MOB07_03770 [Acidobacteria bacterium]|nr:hypothetical protein [Acidobacteriota bacterium]